MAVKKSREISGHAGAIYTSCVDGNLIYTGSGDNYVARWKIDEGVQDKFAIKFEQSVYAIEIMNGILVTGLSNGDLHFFDIASRKELKFYQHHRVGIFAMKYNPVYNQLIIGDADGNVSVWDASHSLLISLPLNIGKIRSIDVSRNGKYFVLGGQDGVVRVFEMETFNELHSFSGHEGGVTSVLFHPIEESRIITGGKDALLKLWNWKREECLRTVVAHTFSIYDLIDLPEAQQIISASRDKNVKVWSYSLDFIERLDHKKGGHKHSVNDLSLIDENSFCSVSDDKRIIVWKVQG